MNGGDKMPVFIRVASPILIALAVMCVFHKIEREHSGELLNNLENEQIIIHLPAVYKWVGYGCALFFSILILIMLFFPNGTESIWVFAGFGFAVLLVCAIILKAKVWRIELSRSKDYFFVRDLLRKTYCISYKECMNYSFCADSLRLETKGGRIRIDAHAVNIEFLLAMLKQYGVEEYRRR